MKLSKAFTLVELMIATAVFASVLLVALTSFIGIGRIYYKGASITQTQASAQQILTQVSNDIQFAPTVVTNPPGTGFSTGSGSSEFICFGNIRYTFNLYKKVDSSNHDFSSKFGLVRDILPGSTGCNSPFGSGSTPLNNPTELLGDNMRLSRFDITASKDSGGAAISSLWNIALTVAYGDDSVLQNPDKPNVACNGNLRSTQFCSVSTQTTTLSRGL